MSWLKRFQSGDSIPTHAHQQDQSDHTPTPQNPTLFQSFEWHTPGSHYTRLSASLPYLSGIGITSIWLPPGCKANNPQSNGYDCYDLWDLGEFDQKWTRSTKWGSREELDELMGRAKSLGISIIWDTVLNHKTAGDATEECWAVCVDPEDRRLEISRPQKIEPWIHYNFPGRGDTYSSLKWHWQHFNGTDWDQRGQKHAIFKIIDPPESQPRPGAPPSSRRRKGWAEDVDDEHGNADYLMFSNIDYTNEEVRQDVLRWGNWMVENVGIDGFRLDAVQHYSWHFAREWIQHVKDAGREKNREIFVVGEYWIGDVKKLVQWVDRMGNGVRAYDTPLLNNFSRLSLSKASGLSLDMKVLSWDTDLRKVFRNSLVQARPEAAVTVVANHDTQQGQASATPIAPYFKALAYALILLRAEGLPCVFHGDLYGIAGEHPEPPACWDRLPSLIMARKLYAYGSQMDYFDSRMSVGWTRLGTWDRRDGCAIVMSIAGSVKKKMYVGTEQAGQEWTDVLENVSVTTVISKDGYGIFPCQGRGISVFVNKVAPGRDQFTNRPINAAT